MRWRLILEEFGPDLVYVPGENNAAADALSRLEALPSPPFWSPSPAPSRRGGSERGRVPGEPNTTRARPSSITPKPSGRRSERKLLRLPQSRTATSLLEPPPRDTPQLVKPARAEVSNGRAQAHLAATSHSLERKGV